MNVNETLDQHSSIRAARWDKGLYPLCTWKNHTALGVLTQTVGPCQCPVACLYKPLDPVATGRPPCLRALSATVILAREADKLTLGQSVNVKVPHAVTARWKGNTSGWPTPGRFTMKNCFAKTYRSNSRLCGHCMILSSRTVLSLTLGHCLGFFLCLECSSSTFLIPFHILQNSSLT